MSTAPYAPAVAGLLAGSHGQRLRVQATHPSWAVPVALEAERCQLGWDARRAPRVSCAVDARVPLAQATLDALDPRTGVRLQVRAGYVLPGGAEDVQLVADLGLRSRTVDRPGNMVRLTAASDEALVLDARAATAYTPPGATVAAAVLGLLTAALPSAPVVATSTLPATAPGVVPVVDVGGDYWSAVDDLLDRVDGDAYDDGLRRWHLVPRPSTVGESAAVLRVGPGGTVTASTVGLSREDEWANAVALTYRWRPVGASDDTTVHGLASATAGPYAVAAAGRRTFTQVRELATTQGEASAAARAVLVRRLAAGRTFRVRTVAPWWLRPGHTVTLQLPTGAQERLLVVAVLYDAAGWADVDLTLPDTASTLATGG